MCATCFGLYLGHPQACQYKTVTKEDTQKKAVTVNSYYILASKTLRYNKNLKE
jgi:hypothetical protein